MSKSLAKMSLALVEGKDTEATRKSKCLLIITISSLIIVNALILL